MTGKKGSSTPSRTTPPRTSPKPGSTPRRSSRSKNGSLQPYAAYAVSIVALAVGIQYLYHVYVYLPNRIRTKSDLPLVGTTPDPRSWGTYRSHVYFGLRTQHPESPLFGMMWYEQPGGNMPKVRHWCGEDDGVNYYMYTYADGRTFGKQVIQDGKLTINTDWLNDGNTWTARIITSSSFASVYALVFYFVLQDERSTLRPVYANGELESFSGFSLVLGNFSVSFDSTDLNTRSFLALNLDPFPDASKILETVLSSTVMIRENSQLRLPSGLMEKGFESNPNLIAFQFNVHSNSTTEIRFSANGEGALKAADFVRSLEDRVTEFSRRFEDVYGLKGEGYADFYQEMGRAALSNMLAGVGYAYGYNRVQSQHSSKPTLYGPNALLSACPCRSTFPRGFLWDEGFHHLLFRKFDPELSLQIISSWLDTMNVDGWIPREMILGAEAEMRVPSEFIIQRDSIANPPMFFFLIHHFLNDHKFVATHTAALVKLYPRLALWYKWLNETQVGPRPGTYRWRGRNATTNLELNPKTLASGLDDYPRATHPSNEEYHLDLHCWMAFSAKVLSLLANIAEDRAAEVAYASEAESLSNFNRLNELFWSERAQRYCDYGLHSTSVSLKRVKSDVKNMKPNTAPPPMVRVVKSPPQLGFVENAFGYLSLYPLMLRLLPHDSDKLRIIIEGIKSDEELWTQFGLRSISSSSPYYLKHNTEHDPPYWRGAIWINMNYLMISALKYYSSISGPNQNLAFLTYSELRNNVVSNMAQEYRRTGNLWESYDDVTGEGRGAHPFTGWSALVLSIMAEQYE